MAIVNLELSGMSNSVLDRNRIEIYESDKVEDSPKANTAFVDINTLTIKYGDFIALKDAHLTMNKNEVLALVGPSGCGKSSLLNSINRMSDRIEQCQVDGQILLDGENVLHSDYSVDRLRRRVGMVFQQANPFPLSIAENIGFPLKDHGIKSPKQRAERIEKVLQQAGLWSEVKDRLHKSALSLSGGQQQRLCIARALALEPELLLLDEPCSALDPLSTEHIESLLTTLKAETTVMIVTHNLGQARRIADRVAVCWNNDGCGCVIESNNTQFIFERSSNPITQAYLRSCH